MTAAHTPTPAEPVSAAVPRWFARHGSLIACLPPGTHCDCVNPCTPVVKLQDVADTVERYDVLVAALDAAKHRIRWLMQFTETSDGFEEIEAELAQWSAALKAAKGEA